MKKNRIDEAINVVAFALSNEYEFYLSCLGADEEQEAANELRNAMWTLEFYGITFIDIAKHQARQSNKYNDPIPFINRAFAPVETDELPF